MKRASSLAGRARRAFRRLGPSGFLRLCAYNLRLLATGAAGRHDHVYDGRWDRAHGVDTAGTLEVAEIDAPATDKGGAVRYEATPPDCFADLVEAAGIRDPSQWTLVDLGSGKGRVPLLAAMAGFGRAVGVEFGRELHAVALNNLARLRTRLPLENITFVQGDARAFVWPPERTLCFLNNPFDGEILDQILCRIEASLIEAPRDVRIVYYHSNHADRIDCRTQWTAIARGYWRDPGHHYALYRWTGAPPAA